MKKAPACTVALLALVGLSCGDDDGPLGNNGTGDPTTGSIHVSLVMSGGDMDSDGCTLTVDGGSSQQVSAGASAAFSHISAGPHEVAIGDVAANCQVDGGTSRSVTVIVGQTAQETFTVVCDWRTRIAFASERGPGQSDIYVMNPNGTEPVRLTYHPELDQEPAWSPDGTRIAFVSWRDRDSEIYAMNADGTGLVNLTNHPYSDRSPTWSPDGTRIAFTRSQDDVPPGVHGEIYVMNSDGTGQVNLTNHPAWDYAPAWSPDGSQIAFGSTRDGLQDAQIFVMNADGSEPVRLTNHFGAEVSAWSPDGTRIAFNSFSSGTDEDIWVISADGTESVNLTDRPGREHHPAWSPDGTRITFESHGEIYAMNPDGTGWVNLTNHPAHDYQPAWSPVLY